MKMAIPSQYRPVIMVCERGFFPHLKVYENEYLLYHIVMYKFKDEGYEVGEEYPPGIQQSLQACSQGLSPGLGVKTGKRP